MTSPARRWQARFLHVAVPLVCTAAGAQTPTVPAPPATDGQPSPQATAPAATQGGTLRGNVVAGVAGKAGGIPLPGVAVTATNSLTGRKYTAATDVDGVYALAIPRNGRYVLRVEFAGFAPATSEVVFGTTDTATGQRSRTSGWNLPAA